MNCLTMVGLATLDPPYLLGYAKRSSKMNNRSTHGPTSSQWHTALASAIIAALFCIVVSGILLAAYFQRGANELLESQQYAALKQQLFQEPEEAGSNGAAYSETKIAQARKQREELKKRIQTLDLQLRRQYFHQRRFARVGAFLLLVGFVVFLISARTAAGLRPWIPMPEPGAAAVDLEPKINRVARWSVAALSLVFVASTVSIAVLFPAIRPAIRPDTQLAVTPLVGLSHQPAAEELKKNWPRFRGSGGLGISAYDNLPTTWDAQSGKSIVWKTPVPLPGNNSPVVWGKRVFLTGATGRRREIYCFDADTGKIVWTRQAKARPQSDGKVPEVLDDTGFAAPGIATDGRCLVAMFANGDVVCTDLDGNEIWTRGLGIPENVYGHAASPLLYKNLVLIQFDQASAGDGKSKALALDLVTGKTVWEKPRKVPNSWASPIVISHAGREQFVTAADPWVIAYSPSDGAELWRAECLSGDHGISPVFAGGLVQVGNEYCRWAAIRPDGKGDVTKTHIAWQAEDGLPDTVSPLGNDQFLFLMTTFGGMTCYDVKTGEMLWEEDFEEEFTSSPSLVGKRLYLFSKTDDGRCWVVESTRDGCRRISESKLHEPCVTSPALQDGRFYIRGQKHLFCIGDKKSP